MSERLLIRYPLFEFLPAQVLHFLQSESTVVDFDTGEILFQEGVRGAWVHLLLEGRVRILRRAESGRDVSLGMVREGELFGEYVLLTPHTHTATCRAASPCRVLRIPIEVLRTIVAEAGLNGALLKQFVRLHASINFVTGRHYLGFMSVSSALTYSELLRREHFGAMRTLSGPGLAKDRWFLITEGLALLTDQTGRCLELGVGDCFGSRCLSGLDADETVTTLTKIECLSLKVSDFGAAVHPAADVVRSGRHEDSQQTCLTQHQIASTFPFVTQRAESDCGLAAAAMVLQFHGRDIKETLYDQAGAVPENGLTLLQLRDLVRTWSLPAEAYRIDVDHVADVVCPFIAHLNNGHFVVVYHVDERSALIADPAASFRAISLASLQETWSGYSVVICPHSS